MKKIKIDGKSLLSIGFCVAAAISAFMTERDKQAQEKTIKDLGERLSSLEKKG
jgi:endo-1,4-beta-D-glucanase Y